MVQLHQEDPLVVQCFDPAPEKDETFIVRSPSDENGGFVDPGIKGEGGSTARGLSTEDGMVDSFLLTGSYWRAILPPPLDQEGS